MSNSRRKQSRQWIEQLESRQLLSAVLTSQVQLTPTYKVLQTLLQPEQTSAANGITPAEMRTAYGVNSITFGSVTGNGAGETIAIVDAYDDPNAAADLHAFDQYFGLADPPSFVKINQNGSTSNLPAASGSSGWSLEESLDVEWAHVMAPNASIVLVEANSDDTSDLMDVAVPTAAKYTGVVAVSMSWSASEDSSETSLDSLFTTPAGHTGVTFLAATGDSGEPAGYPANSPNVIAVGGTTLNISSSGAYISESGWSDSGGGTSLYEARPSYQANVDSTSYRQTPDIALDADPNTGVPVYDSYDNGSKTPWEQVGGTSLSTPMAAGLIAVADQGRVLAGETSLDGRSQALPDLYSLSSSDYHDITSGNNGYPAKAGYDLVTGLGSPIANKWVAGLVGGTTVTTDNLAFTTGPATAQVNAAMSPVVVTVKNSSGSTVTTDNSSITLSIASGPSGAKLNGTATVAAVNGVATFTGLSLSVAGNYTLLATSSSSTDVSATSAGFTITAIPSTLHLTFVTQPSGVVAGNTITPAVTVEVLNQNGTVDSTDVSTITLAIASGPTGGILSGTLTAQTSAGIASFANLQLSVAGNYTLKATDGSITGATSSQFVVSAPVTTTGGLKSETSINNGRNNPAYPYSFTASGNGTLYSVTYDGGAYGYGSIIAVAPGTTLPITVYSFTDGADQAYPSSGVAIDSAGNIYGTTQGDPFRRTNGTIWELAKGSSTITTLYTFSSSRRSSGGSDPFGTLSVDSAGNLYGTTRAGGQYGYGIVFELAAGSSQLTTIWNFTDGNDGAYPSSALVADSAGNLYGTTTGDGYFTFGSVYEISKTKGFVTLYDFSGGRDGNTPQSPVLIDSQGNLYGTTQYGGTKFDGTIWKLNPTTGSLTTLWNFTGGTGGANPYAGVITDTAGNLYGTTYNGGSGRNGTIYELSAGGSFQTLFAFNGTNGSNPFGGVYRDGAGNLYGTTFAGGSYGDGVVYELGLATSAVKPATSEVLTGKWFTPGLSESLDANWWDILR